MTARDGQHVFRPAGPLPGGAYDVRLYDRGVNMDGALAASYRIQIIGPGSGRQKPPAPSTFQLTEMMIEVWVDGKRLANSGWKQFRLTL